MLFIPSNSDRTEKPTGLSCLNTSDVISFAHKQRAAHTQATEGTNFIIIIVVDVVANN